MLHYIMLIYPLKILKSGHVFLDPSDNCKAAAIALEQINYEEDFCLALDFDPLFISRMMEAGFFVMSCFPEEPGEENKNCILLPKHHLLRSCLFFPELHIKKSIKSRLALYDLRYDCDFDLVLEKCIEIHGADWLTEPLVTTIKTIRNISGISAKPVSLALYREEKLVAGEFGIVSGKVYTSYSGYYEEDNAGTVQMILAARLLEKMGFAFWDLGMPLDYKLTFGAKEISRSEFMQLFNDAQER